MIEFMDIDGIKRHRAVYRSPRLTVALRTVEVRTIAPNRLAPRGTAPKTALISDFMTTPGLAVTSLNITETVTSEVVVAGESKSLDNKAPVAEPAKGPKKAKARRLPRLLYGAAAVVVIAGMLLTYQAFMANKAVETQVKKLQDVGASGAAPSSISIPTDKKPDDKNYIQNYKVAPALPQLLAIKKIGVTARIMQVGVDSNNQMEVPKTAYDVAWYNGSSRPGENGAMVIDGHVQGVGGSAIFTDLHKLATGDSVSVTRGDGKTYTYVVTKTETVAVKDLDVGKLLVSTDSNKPGLNLITCAGNFDQKADQFDSRTIVYSVQQ